MLIDAFQPNDYALFAYDARDRSFGKWTTFSYFPNTISTCIKYFDNNFCGAAFKKGIISVKIKKPTTKNKFPFYKQPFIGKEINQFLRIAENKDDIKGYILGVNYKKQELIYYFDFTE